MNKKKVPLYKRVIAYVIDLLIVTLLSGLLSMVFANDIDYKRDSDKLVDITSRYAAGEMTREEYTKEFEDVNYYMTKDSNSVTIINCGMALLYYVVLCYYCKGITLGKYLMKIKIVSANDKPIKLWNYLVRALFVDLILSNLLSIIMVLTLPKETFIAIYSKISSLLTIFLLVTILVSTYREDGRSLHDLIAGTNVISTKDLPKEEKVMEKEEIVEAKIEEKKSITSKNKKKKRDE